MTETKTPTVSYWAVSVLKSRTLWFNAASFIVAALSLSEVAVLIPARFLPLQAAVTALINMWLRMGTVRPVAMISASDTKAVEVPKVGPPPPKAQP